MNLGFSLSDFITIPTFAWNVYTTCKNSSHDFRTISSEIGALHIVLKETRNALSEQSLSKDQEAHLTILGQNCSDVLRELNNLLQKYESLGTQNQRTWDRLRFGLEDVSEFRSRLTSNAALLSGFNNSLLNSSVARIEEKLNRLIDEILTGKREGSGISTRAIESLSAQANDTEAWEELSSELEDMGISAPTLNQHRSFIFDWCKKAFSANLREQKFYELPSPQLDTAPSQIPLVWSTETELNEPVHSRWLAGRRTSSKNQELNCRAKKPSRLRGSFLVFKLFQSNDELHHAARSGDIARISDLLAFGVDVNYLNEQGWTALHAAAKYSRDAAAQLLLSKGAHINIRDNRGTMALHQAGWGGSDVVTKLLIEDGANIDEKDNEGSTALHQAASRGHGKVAQLLVENGADIEARDNNGRTPLHRAALDAHTSVVQFLIEQGADTQIEDSSGRTALHWAEVLRHEAVAYLLAKQPLLDWVPEDFQALSSVDPSEVP